MVPGHDHFSGSDAVGTIYATKPCGQGLGSRELLVRFCSSDPRAEVRPVLVPDLSFFYASGFYAAMM